MPFRTRADARLFYDDVGDGRPPLLLVHGIMCDHRFWGPQVKYFGARHRVVRVDLRGHGRSDAPEQDYTMGLLADDLAWLCTELDLTRPVVIGHSMGGVVALELAARHPELPGAIIALDSALVPPESTRALVPTFATALRGADWQAAQRQLAEASFHGDEDAKVKAWVLERIGAPQHVVASAFVEMFACDTGAAAAACKVPLLYLSSGGGAADLERLRGRAPELIIGQTVGAGHFHQLEVPEQINAMIERFLAIRVGRK